MPKRKADDAWDYVKVVEGAGTKLRKVECTFCDKKFSVSSAGRIKEHLLGKGSSVTACSPKDDKKDEFEIAKAKLQNTEAKVTQQKDNKQTSLDPFLTRVTTKIEAMQSIRDFFYEECIPFRKAKSRSFMTLVMMLSRMSQSEASEFKPPSPDDLAGELLQEYVAEMDKLCEKGMLAEAKFGLSLLSDGWTDCNDRSIFNGIVSTSTSTYYVDNKTSKRKTMAAIADYICSLPVLIPEEVRSKLIHICVDGACKEALPLIRARVEKVLTSVCVLHTYDLLLEDLGDSSKASTKEEFKFFNEVVHKATALAKWVKTRQRLVTLLEERSDKRLLLPVDTRFGSFFIMMQRLLDLKGPLREMFAGEGFGEWKAQLRSADAKATATEWASVVLQDAFWKKLEGAWHIGDVIFTVLKRYDNDDASGNSASVEYVKEGFAELKKNIEALPITQFLTAARKQKIADRVNTRWKYVAAPIHNAAHALSPTFRLTARDDDESKAGLKVCMAGDLRIICFTTGGAAAVL